MWAAVNRTMMVSHIQIMYFLVADLSIEMDGNTIDLHQLHVERGGERDYSRRSSWKNSGQESITSRLCRKAKPMIEEGMKS